MQNISIEYAADGVNYTPLATVAGSATQYVWNTPAQDIPNAKLRIIATDTMGRKSNQESSTFAIRNSPPQFTLQSSARQLIKNQSVTYSGSCDTNFAIQVQITGQQPFQSQNVFQCSSGNWSYTFTPTADNIYNFQFTEADPVGHTTSLGAVTLRETTPPTVSGLAINGGAPSTGSNFVKLSLSATSNVSNVVSVCFQFTTGAPPSLNSSCWLPLKSSDQLSITPAQTVHIPQYFYRVGFTPGADTVYVWAQTEVGNISAPATAQITYQPATPPVLVNVLATVSNTPSNPLTSTDETIPTGQQVFIRWNASAANGLPSAPIALYSTTDDVNFTSIAPALPNAAGTGCTLQGTDTGCYVWTSNIPANGFFRIRAVLTDNNGMIVRTPSNFVNGGKVNTVAGNTDPGLGASAQTAVFYSYSAGPATADPGSFAITNDGTIYFRDVNRGLMVISPYDGIQKLLIPSTGNRIDGPVGSAQLVYPGKIALDYNNGLLIFDYDRIVASISIP